MRLSPESTRPTLGELPGTKKMLLAFENTVFATWSELGCDYGDGKTPMMRDAELLLVKGGRKTRTRPKPLLSPSATNSRPAGSNASAEGIAKRLLVVAVEAVTGG